MPTTKRRVSATRPGFRTLQRLATGSIFHVPTPFVVLVVASAVMWVVLQLSVERTPPVCDRAKRSRGTVLLGINAHGVIVSAYVILGGLTGIAAIVFAFYTNSISPSSHGSFFELYGIAAAVLAAVACAAARARSPGS